MFDVNSDVCSGYLPIYIQNFIYSFESYYLQMKKHPYPTTILGRQSKTFEYSSKTNEIYKYHNVYKWNPFLKQNTTRVVTHTR